MIKNLIEFEVTRKDDTKNNYLIEPNHVVKYDIRLKADSKEWKIIVRNKYMKIKITKQNKRNDYA